MSGFCVLSCCSWAPIAVGTCVGGTETQGYCLWRLVITTVDSCCVEFEWDSFEHGWCLPCSPFGVSFLALRGWCFSVVWRQPPGILILDPFGRGSGAGSGQPLFVFGLGPHGWSYNVICGWLLPVLGLVVPGSGCAVNWGRLPLGLLSKRYRACRGLLLLVWDLRTCDEF